MFEFSTSKVGLVKYWYDEQLEVILAFLVHPLVSKSATLHTTFGYSKQGISRGQPNFQFYFVSVVTETMELCHLPEITSQIVKVVVVEL